MNTISITTSQNIELEYELASIGDRIVGYLVDGLIIIAYCITIAVVLNIGDYLGRNAWLVSLFFLPVVFYSLLSEIFMNGQSVGKKVMGIKVISLSGEQPSLGQYLLRWLFRVVDFLLFTGLVALITVVLTNKKQRIGDVVAGTAVVKTKRRTEFSQTFYTPTSQPEYHVTYPEVLNLRDNDIQLVKEVILTVQRSGNSTLALQAQQKIERVLNIRSRDSEAIYFLHKILADYNFLTASL